MLLDFDRTATHLDFDRTATHRGVVVDARGGRQTPG
jgi:hypothetical protein